MNKKLKKPLKKYTNRETKWSLLAALALATLPLTACGTPTLQEVSSGYTGQTEVDQDITNLDWYINYSWFNTGWGTNLVSKEITKQTGVNINFITPSGNENEKLNALISSDTLPDIVTIGWWDGQVETIIDKDMVWSLNELADKYDPHFWEVANPEVVEWETLEDGNFYGYPNSATAPRDLENHDKLSSNESFLVRKDIYEAIGSPDMSTPEGFYQAVKKAKEYMPEVDGEPLIPVGAHVFDKTGCVSFDKYLQNFLAVPWEKDGKYYDRYTDPDYLTWLKMFRKLNEEGYLSDDIFIDQRVQMEEKIEDGRYFCMIYQYTDMASQEKTIYENNPERIYIAVDGPRNSRGDDPTLPVNNMNGWTVTMISKKCSDPEKAIKLLDFLISEEGQKLVYLGVEGSMYDMVDGKPVVHQEVMDLLNSDRAQYDAVYGADDAYWMLQDTVMQSDWQQPSIEPIEQIKEWTYPYVVYNGQYELPKDSHIQMQDEKQVELWGETLPNLLLAPTEEEFDRILEDFKYQREELGFTELMEEKTKIMQETKEKLHIS